MNIFKFNSLNKKKGFTLIELLVVIAIVGVLSSVVLASVNTARKNARDARRKSDLRQIANALELYRSANSTNGYQVTNGYNFTWFTYPDSPTNSMAQKLVDGGYLGDIITDPSLTADKKFVGSRSNYLIKATKDHYTIWANLENPSQADKDTEAHCWFNETPYPPSISFRDWPGTNSNAAYKTNYCVSDTLK